MVLPVRKTIETPLRSIVLGRCPCCAGRACYARCCYDRLAWFRLCSYVWRFRSRSSFRLWTSLYVAATSCLATVKVPQTQSIAGVSGHFRRHRDRYAQFLLCMVGMVAAMRGSFAAVLQHFSASVHLDVEAQGGGDAGSLTPRCSATPIRCTY